MTPNGIVLYFIVSPKIIMKMTHQNLIWD
jgi:hypothetical protein